MWIQLPEDQPRLADTLHSTDFVGESVSNDFRYQWEVALTEMFSGFGCYYFYRKQVTSQ